MSRGESWGPGMWPGVGRSTRRVPQVPPEAWAEDEPHVLLLLEPEEFVRGVVQLTQVRRRSGRRALSADGRAGCSALGVRAELGETAGLLGWQQVGATPASRPQKPR